MGMSHDIDSKSSKRFEYLLKFNLDMKNQRRAEIYLHRMYFDVLIFSK